MSLQLAACSLQLFSMFTQTRIKLTLWYLLIIMTVSLLFSAAIYTLFDRDIRQFVSVRRQRLLLQEQSMFQLMPLGLRTGPDIADEIEDSRIVSDLRQKIIQRLFLANGAIFVIAGGLGYVLAGRTLQPIVEMMRRQRRFVSDASHELRTPLASMKAATEIYLRAGVTDVGEMKELLTENLRDIERLEAMSSQLLELSRYEDMQSVQRGFVHVELAGVIDQAVRQITQKATAKSISLLSPQHVAVGVHGDEHMLVRLLVILLDNAVKYSPTGTQVSVGLRLRKRPYVEIAVSDQGVGIAHEDMPRIFDRFYRSDVSRQHSRPIEGYGLGLAIAKEIVTMHGGSIWVRSGKGKGTTFTISLPTGMVPRAQELRLGS